MLLFIVFRTRTCLFSIVKRKRLEIGESFATVGTWTPTFGGACNAPRNLERIFFVMLDYMWVHGTPLDMLATG